MVHKWLEEEKRLVQSDNQLDVTNGPAQEQSVTVASNWPFPSPKSVLKQAKEKIEMAIRGFEEHLDSDDGIEVSDAVSLMNELNDFLPVLDNAIQAERNK